MSTKYAINVDASIGKHFVLETVLIAFQYTWFPPPQRVVGVAVWARRANEDGSRAVSYVAPEVEGTGREFILLRGDWRPETLPKYAFWLFGGPSEEALCGGGNYASACLIVDLSRAKHIITGYIRYVGNGVYDVVRLVGKPSNDRRAEQITRIHGDLTQVIGIWGLKRDDEDPEGDVSELGCQYAILTAGRSAARPGQDANADCQPSLSDGLASDPISHSNISRTSVCSSEIWTRNSFLLRRYVALA